MVERITALPNRLEMVRMLNVLPEEGLKLVLAYSRITMDGSLQDGERSA